MSLDLIQTRADFEGSFDPAILSPFLKALPDENDTYGPDEYMKHGDSYPGSVQSRTVRALDGKRRETNL